MIFTGYIYLIHTWLVLVLAYLMIIITMMKKYIEKTIWSYQLDPVVTPSSKVG
jgi:hypothetical protein